MLNLRLIGCSLALAATSFAQAGAASPQFFEGEIHIDKVGGSEHCRANKTKDVQISWQETRNGADATLAGWIVFAGGAPGKLTGTRKGQIADLTVVTNHYDKHLNTPTTLTLAIGDDQTTGTLREIPAKLGFGESMCYWLEATLTLANRSNANDGAQRLKEHAAWYAAHAHESHGDYLARYHQYAEAAAAYELALAAVDGVLPDTRAYFMGLLNYVTRLHAEARDYGRAADRYRRLLDISIRQSELGADDPVFYRGWLMLAGYSYQAKRLDDAFAAIERATRLEPRVGDLTLDERLRRLRLQSALHLGARQFEQAQAALSAEAALARAEVGPGDPRSLEPQMQAARLFLVMKEKSRFEAVFPALAEEIVARFGEGHELPREASTLLGRYLYTADDLTRARPWLERAIRGYRQGADSTAEAIRENDDAKEVLAALLEIYIKQGIVPGDFLGRVKAGTASLDDLPFAAIAANRDGLPTRLIAPAEIKRLHVQ